MLIGRYQDLVLESRTSGFRSERDVRVADEAELAELKPFLAPGDHEDRIRHGNLCVVVEDDAGHPVGLQWVNRYAHQDRYLGRLTKPTESVAYLNQTIISPNLRGRGHGRRLMAGTLALAHELGVERVRLFVDRDNRAMRQLCDLLGFEQVASQVGVRIGGLTLRMTRHSREIP